MKPVLIDLSEYVQTGKGANGYSYDSLKDENYMVKMYVPEYDTSTIITEQEVAHKVFEIGIPSPEPGELVTDGERIGIRFRKVPGKRSFARAFSQEPGRVEEFSREFARHCKKLHSVECPEGMFPDAKKDFRRLLDASKCLSAEQKERVGRLLDNIPEYHTALHGDMHFGNLLTTLPIGAPIDAPHDVLWIDLGYFSYGYPLMDLGMCYQICNFANEEFLLQEMHFNRQTGLKAWKAFADEYFFGPERLGEKYFGAGITPDGIDERMKPFAILKLLLVEYNLGFMPENYVNWLDDTFAGKIEIELH